MKTRDIVGYTYQADTLCDVCVVDALRGRGPFVTNPLMHTEDALDVIARDEGVDRQDERSFDSGDFPKVIFADSAEDLERCGCCGEFLIGEV